MCGNAIVFPAVPPARGGKTIEVEKIKPIRRWAWNARAIAVYLRDYPHWKTLWQIAVPFVIVAALLAGAAFVKNRFTDQPASAPAPVVQTQSGGWDKMTEFTRADQKVQQDLQSVLNAKKLLMDAQHVLDVEQKRYNQAHGYDEQQAISGYVQSAQRSVAQVQNMYDACHRHFQADLEVYRKLGGTIDYNSRVPNH
jgi:hypothetical protein